MIKMFKYEFKKNLKASLIISVILLAITLVVLSTSNFVYVHDYTRIGVDKDSLYASLVRWNGYVIDNGKAPIMNVNGVDVRMQLHHVVSKANDIFRVVPMTPQNHILFHKTYGYYYSNPKLPWIMFDGLPRI